MTDFDSMDAEATLEKLMASFNLPDLALRDELTRNQMLILSGTFAQWAMTSTTEVKKAIELLGWARGMQDLAALTELDWEPPEPERVSLLVFIARKLEEQME